MFILQSLTRMFNPFMDAWAARYQAQVGAELKKYGLRADDLIDGEYHPVSDRFEENCVPRMLDSACDQQ